MFSKFENEALSSETMTQVIGGRKPGPWGETVAHGGYPDGDSGRTNSGVPGGVELDDPGVHHTTTTR